MRAEPSTSPRAARWIGAGAFRSFLVASHLVISLFCGSWPLLFYVLAGGLGAWSGPRLHRRLSGDHPLAKLARALAIGLAAFTVIGLTALTIGFHPSAFVPLWEIGVPINGCVDEG